MELIIYTDGGSRGNPGIAGSGTVVYAADGKTVLREIAYVVGKKSTNNVAEYHGLLRGLEAALDMGATKVALFMDSKLVVEQVTGRWKIKHPDMQELAAEAKDMISQIDDFQITWVARKYNKVADALSNVAMDACAKGHPVGIVGAQTSSAPGEKEAPARSVAPADKKANKKAKKDAPARSVAPAEKDAAAEGLFASPSAWTGKRDNAVRMILIRHGETAMNKEKKYSGLADVELTDKGRQQAKQAARLFAGRDIAAVVSSPLGRCQETAKAFGCDIEVVEDLRELDFGQWEGLTFAAAAKRDPQLHATWLSDSSVATPEGESLQALHRRVRKARLALQKNYAGKTIVVVSHAFPIKSLLRQALDAGPVTMHRIHLDVASVSEVEFFDGGSLVHGVNQTAYLG